MLTIQILVVGKLKEKYWVDACEEYRKRLSGMCKISVIEVDEFKLPNNPTQGEIEQGIAKEGQKLIEKAGKSGVEIPLCIEGATLSSEELSEKIAQYALNGESTLTFYIGGSYGLATQIKSQGKLKLSLSRMTFTHQFARVMLLEQIYRALSIQAGAKYHK